MARCGISRLLPAMQHVCGGMARTSARVAANGRPAGCVERGIGRPARARPCQNGARDTLFGSLARVISRNVQPSRARERCTRLHFVALVAALLHVSAFAANRVESARVWPAEEYTRLTLESNAQIAYNIFTVGTPARLVLDLEDVEFNATLEQLPAKISPSDPYVSGVRIGRFKPGVVRLVLDLKAPVKPQVFVLKPVGEYGHRLVLDVYPLVEADPVMALLDKKNVPSSAVASPESADQQDKTPDTPGAGPGAPGPT